MDNNEAFSEWFEKQYGAKPQPSPKKGDISHSSVYMTMFADGAYKGWQAAQQQSSETNASLVRMNLSLAKENGALKADNERLREALEIAKISSCSCLTKTHEHEYHDKNCRYRIYCEALSATTSQSLQAHDERNP
jgi:hypothetical protein